MENANTSGHTAIVLVTVHFLGKLRLFDKAWFELLMVFTEAQRECTTAYCKKGKRRHNQHHGARSSFQNCQKGLKEKGDTENVLGYVFHIFHTLCQAPYSLLVKMGHAMDCVQGLIHAMRHHYYEQGKFRFVSNLPY